MTPLLLVALFLVVAPAPAAAPLPVTPLMKTFGHSIKAGRLLPAGNEIDVFEHRCRASPCSIT
eukprot:COSAG01_NODE_21848_length_882_cov_1.355045_1_plen_62_part_10